MKAAVLGMSGYTGMVLMHLLAGHPHIEAIIPVSSSKMGEAFTSLNPGFDKSITAKLKLTEGKVISLADALTMKIDVVFSALPHLISAELCSKFYPQSVIIDLSADFRLDDSAIFKQAYGCLPPVRELQKEAVYGLAEWNKPDIRTANIIANPGCYPTATLLPLLPLIKEDLLKDNIVINAISGISGAGKKLNENLLYCERLENTGAYTPGTRHRHSFEIAHKLKKSGFKDSILFTPHLAPLKQGMAITTVAKLTKIISEEEIFGLYKKYYGDNPFICLRQGSIPQTKDVWGSNRCDIGWHRENGFIMLFSVIDNLMKGAAGQAIQNMNIRFGFDEISGLSLHNKI